MSKFTLVIILACFSSAVLFAQGTEGRIGNTPQTTLEPSATVTKTGKALEGTDRSTPVGQNRSSSPTTFGNPKVKPIPQERAARSADPKGNRPASYAPPTTTKGMHGAAQKVAPIKSAERGIVKWMTIEQALEKSKTEKRKIFLDMYTDWCGWCKHMDSTTFVNASVAEYLNKNFYPVKFNAEQEKDIVFKDKTYKFKKNGSRGYHELAAMWLNNRLSFPTVVFLDEGQQLIQPVPGYQDAGKMEAIINYFGSDSHKKTPWESYEKNFSNKK